MLVIKQPAVAADDQGEEGAIAPCVEGSEAAVAAGGQGERVGVAAGDGAPADDQAGRQHKKQCLLSGDGERNEALTLISVRRKPWRCNSCGLWR